MRVQCKYPAALTILASDDQVGDRLHAGLPDRGSGHRVLLGGHSHVIKQCGSALRMRRIVAWRCVSRDLDDRSEEVNFLIEMRVDPAI